MTPWFSFSPVARQRIQRFRAVKRAWWSLWLLVGLYVLGLGAELLCNRDPYVVRCAGRWYFPFLAAYNEHIPFRPPSWGIYPQDLFLHDGIQNPPDYKALQALPAFRDTPGNFMVFSPIPYGKNEIIDVATLPVSMDVTVRFEAATHVATVDLTADGAMLNAEGFAYFCGATDDAALAGQPVATYWQFTPELKAALALRWRNEEAPLFTQQLKGAGRLRAADVRLPAWTSRSRAPAKLRLTFEELPQPKPKLGEVVFREDLALVRTHLDLWADLSAADREIVLNLVKERLQRVLDPQVLTLHGETYRLRFERESRNYPFRPAGRHFMGLDNAGRDVFARILYALRLSLNFGFLLVLGTFVLGIAIGAIQGYFGGWLDITGQRLIEIWSAIPFLYVMILLGSVYGRSFVLLLIAYAVFNWIGISYFLRAEFLKLRRQQFVEAAKCLGIPSWRIMSHHILPNALVPVITLFPFSLVGAIGALNALDYLGFGLPPPTPSWGELMNQAQIHTRSWWLTLYPFLALFVVILLGVFIGEGIRSAYDPRSRANLK